VGSTSWNPLRVLALVGGAVLSGAAAVLPVVFPPAAVVVKPLVAAGAYLIGVATKTPGHTPQ
jgi:hypothetical protein